MKFLVLMLITAILTAGLAAAYNDVTIISPRLTFITGHNVIKYNQGSILLVEDPAEVNKLVKKFNSDLDLYFWEDPDFHPAIFKDYSKYKPCGIYPTRMCFPLNQYGGFIIADNKLPYELIGYGAYDRMTVSYGKLFPSGFARHHTVAKNMEILSFSYGRENVKMYTPYRAQTQLASPYRVW